MFKTTVAGISEAEQKQKRYQARVRAGSKAVKVPESKVTRAGGRESTEVKQSKVIHRRVTEYPGKCLEMSARAKQDLAISVSVNAA